MISSAEAPVAIAGWHLVQNTEAYGNTTLRTQQCWEDRVVNIRHHRR